MNDKYYVNFNGFDEYKRSFEEKINEFREELFNVYKAYLKVDWEGEGNVAFNESFTILFDKLNYIPQVLDLFTKFMEQAMNNYSEGMEEIKKSFDSLLELIREEKLKRGELTNGE